MSATLDEYDTKLLQQAFNFNNKVIRFDNIITFFTGTSTPDFTLESEVREAYDDLEDLLFARVMKEYNTQPLIIFMERDEPKLREKL